MGRKRREEEGRAEAVMGAKKGRKRDSRRRFGAVFFRANEFLLFDPRVQIVKPLYLLLPSIHTRFKSEVSKKNVYFFTRENEDSTSFSQ